jgi:hypothetical protein
MFFSLTQGRDGMHTEDPYRVGDVLVASFEADTLLGALDEIITRVPEVTFSAVEELVSRNEVCVILFEESREHLATLRVEGGNFIQVDGGAVRAVPR